MVYEKEVRNNATRLADQIGAWEASKQLDIPYSTLLRWQRTAEASELISEYDADNTDPERTATSPVLTATEPASIACKKGTLEELRIRVLEKELSELKAANATLMEMLNCLLARLRV